MDRPGRREGRHAIRTAAIYLLLAVPWILLSDRLLSRWVGDPALLTWLQTVKGWGFVLGSAALIYWLVRRDLMAMRRIRKKEARSERKRREVEEALQENRRALSTLLENMPGMAYRCRNDPDWPMEFVSQGCEKLTGYAANRLVGGGEPAYGELIHPSDRAHVWDEVQAALNERRAFQVTYRITTADDTTRWVWEQGCGVFDDGGALQAIEGIITDITERQNLQEQLRQAQKMESIGRLAGGVAHDFNNVLTAITGYCQLARGSLENGDPGAIDVEELRHDLREIEKAGQRATSLTGQLLAFSRQQPTEPRVLDLNVILEDMYDMVRRLLGADIELAPRLDPEVGKIRADPGQMEQIVLNLAVNARDAMPDGGRLSIETSAVELDEGYTASHLGVEPGEYVLLAVTDTGVGMDAETQSQIFEPFFTTKEPGKGTGLGLSTVYGIVKQSGGHIWVYSQPGLGTTFKIYLPVTERREAAGSDRARPSVAGEGTETVLVIEDEQAICRLIRRSLETAGYTVLTASDGAEGMRSLSEGAAAIDLLITDMVLPLGSGRHLADLAADLNPEMKILQISGYTEASLSPSDPALTSRMAFLQKPFSPEGLKRAVRGLLDRSGRSDGAPLEAR